MTQVFARLPRVALWRNPIFQRLLTGQMVVNFGGQVSALAVPTVAILYLNAGPMEVGILAALPWLPSPLLGPLAGALIDRFPRRPVMVAADLGRCLCLLAMAAGLGFGAINLLQLYVIAFALGSLSMFHDVAYQAYLPSAFTDRELLQVNARIDLAKSPALVGGAAIAGLLLSTTGPARSVIGASVTFLVNAINLAALRPAEAPNPETGPRRSLLAEMGDGLLMVARNPILRSIATATAVSNLGVFMFTSVSLLFAYRSLHLTAGVIGIVLAGGNLGFLIGAALAPEAVRRLGLGRTLALSQLFLAFSLFFAPLALFGLPLVLFGGSLLLQNFHNEVYGINQVTLRQSITPRQAQGRMNATMRAIIVGAVPVGSVLGGYLGTTLGLPQTMLLGGAIALLAPLFLLGSPVVRLRSAPGRPREGAAAAAAG